MNADDFLKDLIKTLSTDTDWIVFTKGKKRWLYFALTALIILGLVIILNI